MIDQVSDALLARFFFQCEVDDIAANVILTVTNRLDEFEPLLTRVTKRFKGFHKGISGTHDGLPVTIICSGMGASRLGDLTLALGRIGCRNLLFHGFIGALRHAVELGSLIVATEAANGEGFCRFLHDAPAVVRSAPAYGAATSAIEAAGKFDDPRVVMHPGAVFTIGSFMAETRGLLDELVQAGYVGVEMETAAVYAAAIHSQINALGVHFVTDLPCDSSLFQQIPFDRGRLRTYRGLPAILIELATSLADVAGSMPASSQRTDS